MRLYVFLIWLQCILVLSTSIYRSSEEEHFFLDSSKLPRVYLHHTAHDCPFSLAEADSMGWKMNEMLQEAGFASFFRHHYAHVVQHRPHAQFTYFPICPFTATIDAAQHKVDIPATRAFFDLYPRRGPQLISGNAASVFYPAIQPFGYPRNTSQFSTYTALVVDRDVNGQEHDIIVPQSVRARETQLSSRPRINLLFGAGHALINRITNTNIRNNTFNLLHAASSITHIPVNISYKREYDEYRLGFTTSHFCLSIPGHTLSSSLLPRAITSHCIPIILVYDTTNVETDLPFGRLLNYSSFSLMYKISDLSNVRQAETLLQTLQNMINTNQYSMMLSNLVKVSDFFNYHSTSLISPYGAVLWELAKRLEYKR